MIRILCVGKIKEKYLTDLVNDYLTRISKYHKIEVIELKDYDNHKKELDEIKKHINSKDYNIALDLRGKMVDSVSLAHEIDNIFISNSNITFIIGGSNGLDEETLSMCKESISFSHLTFPHGLFRGILLEQIYRSFKILNNESYHK